MKTSILLGKPNIHATFLFWSCIFVSCFFGLPANLRGDDSSDDPSTIPTSDAAQGKEFPSSVGLYVWAEGLSSSPGTVELKATSEIVLKLKDNPNNTEDFNQSDPDDLSGIPVPPLIRKTDLALSETANQAGQWVSSGTTVYLPVSTQQEISFHDITTNNLSKFRIHVNVPSEYVVYFYNEALGYYEESSAYECNSGTQQVLFFVKLRNEQGMPAGKPLDITPGESTLRMGLGYLPNGQSAGYLDFNQESLTGFFFCDLSGGRIDSMEGIPAKDMPIIRKDLPGRMTGPFYCFPTSPDVKLVFTIDHGAGGLQVRRLKQIITPSVLVNIGNGYGSDSTIAFYPVSKATIDNTVDKTQYEGTPYQPNSDPFVTYTFATNWTITEDSRPWQTNTSIKRTEGTLTQNASFMQQSQTATVYCKVMEPGADGPEGMGDGLDDVGDDSGNAGDDLCGGSNGSGDDGGDPSASPEQEGEGVSDNSPDGSPPDSLSNEPDDSGAYNGSDGNPIEMPPLNVNGGSPGGSSDGPDDGSIGDGWDDYGGEPGVGYDYVPQTVIIPRKTTSIIGFNGARIEFGASDYDSAELPTTFNGDSYQIACTDASMRLVGRYGAARVEDYAYYGDNDYDWIVSTYGESIVDLAGEYGVLDYAASHLAPKGANRGAPAYISTREVAYQFTGTISGSLGDFMPDLVNGNYGYRTDRQYYDIDLATGDRYPGQLYWEENPDRSWSMFGYYTDPNRRGLISRVVTPFGDTGRPSSLPSANNISGYSIKTTDYAADWNGAIRLPSLEQNWVNGVLVSWANHAYSQAGTANNQPVWQATTTNYAASSSSVGLTSILKVYQGKNIDPLYRGLPYSMQAADGTKTCYAYEHGSVTAQGDFTASSTGGAFRSITMTGIAAAGTGMSPSDCSQSIDGITFVDGQSTRTDTIRNEWGLVAYVRSYVYSNGSWALLDTETRTYDTSSNLISTENSAGKAEYTYTINGRLQSSTDASGVTTQYTCDQFGHVTSTLRLAMAGVPELLTQFTYDADGRVTSKTIGSDPSDQLKSTYEYNYAGQLTKKVEQGIQTTYSYDTFGGQILSVTETHGEGSDSSSLTTSKNRDGTVRSKTGTTIVPEYYAYSVEGGNLAVKTSYGSSGSPRWSETWKDGLGRVVQTQVPLAAGVSTVQNTYNAKGQLEKTTTSGYADTTYGYDAFGGLTDTMIGGDSGRRNGATTKIVQRDSQWWSYNETIVYPDAGSTGVANSKTWTRLTGFDSVSIPQNTALPANGKVISEVITQDAAGNETRSLALVDRATGSRYDISTIAVGSAPSVSLSRAGLALQSVSSSGVSSSISYDALCRPKRTEGRTSASSNYAGDHIVYVPGTTLKDKTYNDRGDLVAKFTYDSMGRVITSSAPTVVYLIAGAPSGANEGILNTTNYEYNARGQTTRVYGTATNPVSYEFNAYGDLTKQTTYRDESAATGDTTTFARNAADGSLTSRTDAQGNTVLFGYNNRGQIATIQSARVIAPGVGIARVMTTYGYDNNTGDLTSVTYNDGLGTPGIYYTYDRMGRVISVKDATGSRTFAYNNSDLRITHEYLGQTALGAADNTSVYGSTLALNYAYGAVNHQAASVNSGFTITNGANTDYSFALTRDDQTGRLASIISDAGQYNFDYLPNSDFIQHIGESTRHMWGQTRTYEPDRDLLAGISTLNGPTTVASYGYTSDAVSRRYQVVQTGQIFDPYCPDGQEMFTQYAYDSRSQVTASITRVGSASNPSAATELKGRGFTYAYDSMGNRTQETANGETFTYQVNSLNQYEGRTTGTTVPASGVATPGTAVSIDGTPLETTDWQNGYFFKTVPKKDPDNGGTQAILFQAISGGQAYASIRNLFVRPLSEPFSYDADGNLRADSLWDYVYNAADQLVQATSKFPDQTGKCVLIKFTYDYMGRRAAKQVYDADANGIATTCRSKTVFVYQGWALIAEYEADTSTSTPNLTLKRSFTWGPDLTGGADAGCIGGLLAIQDHRNMYEGTYNPAFDGNGNVTALIHAQTGMLAAAYEYDAYGNAVRTSGAYATENPIRFSSKYQDSETGLLYYGFRYYSPSMGRFINRDPLKEDGGLNIYAMTSNNPIGRWDYLGMFTYYDQDGDLCDSDDTTDDIIQFGPKPNSGNNDEIIQLSTTSNLDSDHYNYPSLGMAAACLTPYGGQSNISSGANFSLTDGFNSMSDYTNMSASDPFKFDSPWPQPGASASMTSPLLSDANFSALGAAMAKPIPISSDLSNFLYGTKTSQGSSGTVKPDGSGSNWNNMLTIFEFTLASAVTTINKIDGSTNNPIQSFSQATLAYPYYANTGNGISAKISSASAATTVSNAFNGRGDNSWAASISYKKGNVTGTVGFGSSASPSTSYFPSSTPAGIISFTSMISSPRGVTSPHQGYYGFASVSYSFRQFQVSELLGYFR